MMCLVCVVTIERLLLNIEIFSKVGVSIGKENHARRDNKRGIPKD